MKATNDKQMNMKPRVTKPQLIAITVLTLVALGAGVIIAALYGNFGMKPKDTQNQSAYSSSILGLAEAKASETVTLKDGDTYNLTASIVKKNINGADVKMLAYNGSIPGPLIKVPQGAEITLNFKNDTDVDSTIHSHGVRAENKFDGVPDVTQKAVKPGESFTYRLKFLDEGIFWYHPHIREDYAQELGLYGNYLVTPAQKDYWAEVDREEALFLDDILIENGQIATFSRSGADHTLMGRFGNVMLINGNDKYKLSVKQGERVRLYLTNAANTRIFNFSIPNTRMKLVGADNGKYEREEWVDSVVIGPSERSVVEIWFDQAGDYQIVNKTPEKTYTMGRVSVASSPVTTSYLLVPRVNQDFINSLASLRPLFGKIPDKNLTLSLDMMNDQSSENKGNTMEGHNMQMMGNEQSGNELSTPTPSETQVDKIEWEDTMGNMNKMSDTKMIKWKFVDTDTNKTNMDINWQFKKGETVKIKIFNDPKSAHPMQHPIHIHGQRFLVTSINGTPNTNLVFKDTVLVQNGDTLELVVPMQNPGNWVIHCHIPEHMEADMMMKYQVI